MVCPLSMCAETVKNCHSGCVLLINSECGLKIIAEKIKEIDSSRK